MSKAGEACRRRYPANAGVLQKGRNPFLDDNMIRERVGPKGQCRELEIPAELPALRLPLVEMGVVKEGPVSPDPLSWLVFPHSAPLFAGHAVS